jgi:biopolymer transport protein ExbB
MERDEADQHLPLASEVRPAAPSEATAGAQADPASVDPSAAVPGESAGMAPGSMAELLGPAGEFLDKGGIAIWAIAALSVATLAIILWKLWRYSLSGVWRRARADLAVDLWRTWRDEEALDIAAAGRGVRARVATTAIRCAAAPGWTDDEAREETVRVAKGFLAGARAGLRPLELIATIAPLLGLLGTVLGMISAFQQLQAAGTRADPSALAGGIWEALLTTAAGMAVAIPASAALTWFESVNDRLRHDLEDIATRIFARPRPAAMKHAAE